jgi:hypothetical protein
MRINYPNTVQMDEHGPGSRTAHAAVMHRHEHARTCVVDRVVAFSQ